MIYLKVLLVALSAMFVVVIVVPFAALLDLLIGGTGLGLCPTGLGTCSTSIYVALELLGVIALSATVIGAGIAWCQRQLQLLSSRT